MKKLLHIDNRLLRQDGRILMEGDGAPLPDIDLSGKNWFTLTYKLNDSILENTNYWNLPVVSVADGTTIEIYIAPKHQYDNMGFTENINLTEENRVQSYKGDTGIDLKYVNMGFVFNSQSEFSGLNWTGYLTFTVAFDGNLTTSDELISLFGGYDEVYSNYFSDSVATGYGDYQSYIRNNGGPDKFTYAQPYYIDFGNFNYKTTHNSQHESDIIFHNIFQFIGNEFLSGIQLGKVFDIYERNDMSGYFANIGICNENGCYINWYEDEHGNRFWLDYNGVSSYMYMFANSRIYPEFYNQFSQHYYPYRTETLPNGDNGRMYYELDKIYLANARVYNDGWELTVDHHGTSYLKSRDARMDELAAETVDGFNSINLDNSYLHFMDQQDEYGIYVHGGYNGIDGNMYALSGNYYGGRDKEIDFWGYLQDAKGFDMSDGNSLGNIFFRPSQIWKIGDMSRAMWGSNVSRLDMRVDKLMFNEYDQCCYENPYYNTLNASMTFFTHAIENNQDYLFIITNFYINNESPDYYELMISPFTSDCTLYMLNTYFHDNGGELASNVYDYGGWPADLYTGYGYLVINPDITGTGFESELEWISEYYHYDMGDASLYPYPYSNKSSTAYWKKCFDESNWTTETDLAFEYEYVES